MKNIFKIDLARKKLVIEENGKFDVVENEELLPELSQTEDVIIAEARCCTLDKIIPIGSLCVFSKEFINVDGKVVLLEMDGKEYRIKQCFDEGDTYVFKPNSNDPTLKSIVIDKNNTSVRIIGVMTSFFSKFKS